MAAEEMTPYGREAAEVADQVAAQYAEEAPRHQQSQIAAVERLLPRLPRAARVLDAGCGTGRPTCAQLSAAGLDVTGIDVSEAMLTAARANVPGARFLQVDLLSEQAADLGTFDTVVSFFCLMNLPEPVFVSALARFASLTRPGGTVLVGVPERPGGAPVKGLSGTYHPPRCTRQDLLHRAGQAGLRVEELDARPGTGIMGAPETHLYLHAHPATRSARSAGVRR
ncbi:bifunctional 2-polyprenyl-6-hydroxyphenol methylase/3-demethylubiquinol 3-O-methyltransferase UbiG [Streptomyces rimosus]|uniref:class I SAM-dependent methyltransferase n=1 Tax=Streptomyces rimosus TaxID=1927 RepID=UPI000AFDC720|nr:class I SAM-dependent methyltransferase [Streptomyces rimosus]